MSRPFLGLFVALHEFSFSQISYPKKIFSLFSTISVKIGNPVSTIVTFETIEMAHEAKVALVTGGGKEGH